MLKSLKSKIFNSNFPFSVAKCPFYYGWIVFIASVATRVASVPAHNVGICAFTEPIIEILCISRITLSNIFLFSMLSSALVLPLFGRWFDKIGVRNSSVFSLLMLSMSLLFLGSMGGVLSLLSAGFTKTVAVVILLFIGFCALKLFGQSLAPLTSRMMLLKWYDRKSNTIIGLSGLILSFAFGLSPKFTAYCIDCIGAFPTWICMGVAVLVIFMPLVWLLCRNSPEECNIAIDGSRSNAKDEKSIKIESSSDKNLTLKQALCTFDFWIFVIAASNTLFLTTGIQIHIVDIFRESGVSSDYAFGCSVYVSLISAFGGVLLSWLQDKMSIKNCLLIVFSVHICLLYSLELISSNAGFIIFVVCFGVNWAMYGIVFSTPWAKLFGRNHLGHIMSTVSLLTIIASSIAPSVMSYSKVYAGSYLFATRIISVISVILLVSAIVYIRRTRRR